MLEKSLRLQFRVSDYTWLKLYLETKLRHAVFNKIIFSNEYKIIKLEKRKSLKTGTKSRWRNGASKYSTYSHTQSPPQLLFVCMKLNGVALIA